MRADCYSLAQLLTRGILLLLFAAVSPRVFSGIRPSFYLEHSVFTASDVIKVDGSAGLGGNLPVIEVWKGLLKPGDQIKVPALAEFQESEKRVVHPFYINLPFDGPTYVSGSQIVLFLKRVSPNSSDTTSSEWAPASPEGMAVSTLWVEGKRTFAWVQLVNPGPTLLTECEEGLENARQRAKEMVELQAAFEKAKMIADGGARAKVLRAFASDKHYFVTTLAFSELEKCRLEGLPVLREMLQDPSVAGRTSEIVKCFAEAGGHAVDEELTAIVRQETDFWKATGPGLKQGWWNDMADLRDRYCKMSSAIEALKKARFPGCRTAISDLRDFWSSLPQLNDKSGLDRLVENCDQILQELPAR